MELRKKFEKNNFVIVLILITITLICCKPNKKKIAKISIKNNSSDNEYILIDSIKINNLFLFKGEKRALKLFKIELDSINKYGYECGSEFEEVNIINYYGKSEVEVIENEYCFRKISLEEDKFYMEYQNIKFDREYTLENLKKDFPTAFNKKYSDNRDFIEIQIPTIEDATFSTVLKFKFKENKLIEIVYFIPC